jgi:hypothetical protein
MCFVLYAGTAKPLPRKNWQENSPEPSVESLTENAVPVKAHFTKPEVQYVGSTSGCGCDFPHVTLQNGGWPYFEFEPDLERDETERHNRASLVCLLRNSEEETVELYGVWDGDFGEKPKSHEHISLDVILDPKFRFKEQGFYTVTVKQ